MTKKTVIAVSAVFAAILVLMLALIPAQRRNEFYDKWGLLAELSETDANARYITEHEELYPQEVLNYFYSNADELEFVRNYPENKDNYLSMTYTADELNGDIPALYMSDPRWAYELIGDGFYIKDYGCEIVSLTMAYVGLTGRTDLDPVKITYIAAELDALGLFGGVTAEKTSELCGAIGLNSVEYCFADENGQKNADADVGEMKAILDGGHVILAGMIGDTFGNHALIIAGHDGDNFIIHDPAGEENTSRMWSYDELNEQMHYMWDLSA
ncbi:MAG: hypothetical protein NC395_00900 [Prevotella sp.]|nr:hypothetical protein [Prevotella sp.]